MGVILYERLVQPYDGEGAPFVPGKDEKSRITAD